MGQSHRKFDRRLKNSDSLAQRVDEHLNFVGSLADEEVWIREQILACEMQIEQLHEAADGLAALIQLRPSVPQGRDRLLHLQDAGNVHALRKSMTRYAAQVEALLVDIHGHPAFRDDVAAIAPLEVPEEHRGHGTVDHFKAENVFLSALGEFNRMEDALRRLRRRMTMYLRRKQSLDRQVSTSHKIDSAIDAFQARSAK
ncbi:MAG: hypothetical protein PUJ57_04660 [Peptoniphilaceae bacterium]|nr:hypothetical protein [Peptoniphilaceae bacterium]